MWVSEWQPAVPQHTKPRVAQNREKLRWCLKGEQTPAVPDDLWFSCRGVRQEGPQQSQLVQERRTFSAGREVKEMILRRQGLVSVRKKSSVHAGFALQCPRQEVWCAAWCWRGACLQPGEGCLGKAMPGMCLQAPSARGRLPA